MEKMGDIRQLKNISLETILDLITSAEDYGFEDDILFDAFAEMMDRELSADEIYVHAKWYRDNEAYGEEDYVAIKEKLIDFKKKYCSSK